ncbi:hypothetical protein IGI04_013879 [Brassica rapa subsp. trilocularis]|uniref:DUF4005 domain-containing protein n=1 Tax=Brassica rapa subsp. trilocularis TaxID=1813537 RepID=A0ABQ7NA38_BRACM|nr:hypothetical protein IGI04_013879 [Brassica rapa subsp. trilocularis]
MGQAQEIHDGHTAQTTRNRPFALDAPQGDATTAGAPNLQSLRTYTHVHRRTVFTPEGSSDNRERLRLWTTRNAGHCDSLHLPATRADYGETEKASTSRRQEPAAAKLWKPPPPGNRTQTTIIFTAPTLQATASSLQDQNHRGRCLARGQTRRPLEETRRRKLRIN